MVAKKGYLEILNPLLATKISLGVMHISIAVAIILSFSIRKRFTEYQININ